MINGNLFYSKRKKRKVDSLNYSKKERWSTFCHQCNIKICLGTLREINHCQYLILDIRIIQAVSTILNAKFNEDMICSAQPYGCEQNCSFIVHVSLMEDKRDIQSDDLGLWLVWLL